MTAITQEDVLTQTCITAEMGERLTKLETEKQAAAKTLKSLIPQAVDLCKQAGAVDAITAPQLARALADHGNAVKAVGNLARLLLEKKAEATDKAASDGTGSGSSLGNVSDRNGNPPGRRRRDAEAEMSESDREWFRATHALHAGGVD